MSGGDGESLRAIDAHEPAGFAPRFGGEVEVVILAPRFEVAQSIAEEVYKRQV